MEVRIENLTKTFVGRKGSKTTAVSQMSFVVPDGKLIGLLGPSGCGKSTTLYMIAGLHKPTEGHIWFGEDDVTNVPPENRGIGLVFQNYALYPHFSVKQNITFPLDNIRLPGPFDDLKERVKEAKNNLAEAKHSHTEDLIVRAQAELDTANANLEKAKNEHQASGKKVAKKLSKQEKDAIAHEMARIVDIEPYLERKPKELSGGQQQRVAIARALAKRPRVLLLDEPLSNLDARLRLQTREEIKRIQRETGITTVFVTHDQEEAMSISDVIVVMKMGVIQQIDEPQKVYDEPANLFVAKFLGSPAINVFDGAIRDGKLYINDQLFDDDKIYQDTYLRHISDDEDINAIKGKIVNDEGKELKKEEVIAKIKKAAAELAAAQEALKDKRRKKAAEETAELDLDVSKVVGVIYEEVTDRPVKIAVRPESFVLDDKGRVPVTVEFVEHIGRDISVIGHITDQEKSHVKIIIPSELREKVISRENLKFKTKRFYVFEETGERIK